MSEMEERVAKALCRARAYPDSVWEAFKSEARAAIEAIEKDSSPCGVCGCLVYKGLPTK